jgi:ligand-binding sensor protein/sugar diacid utilization regulator/GAF domain-containing protein
MDGSPLEIERAPGDSEERASSAPVGAGFWQLTDLIGVETLQSIQDTFARTFGLPTVIIDPLGRNVTEITHRVRFCEDLTRTSLVGGPRCTACDRRAMRRAAATSQPSIFHCWNGLYDAAIPIALGGRVLGYFLCGQILHRPADGERARATAVEIGVPAEDYASAIQDVKVIPPDRYRASVQSMHVLAQMIAEQAAAAINSLQMLEEALRAREGIAKLIEELDAILEALREIGSQPDYLSTLEAIADNLNRLIPSDSCVIHLVDTRRNELVPVSVRDPYPDALWAYRPALGQGIGGRTAETGVARKIDDVRGDPDFHPIPGIPVEPEAMLVAPMVHKGVVSGVISLSRFRGRSFNDHDLQVLSVFASQASVSIQVSKLHSENAQRLREERSFADLLRSMSQRLRVEDTLAEIGTYGIDLLGAGSAVLRVSVDPVVPPVMARIGIRSADATRLLEELESEVETCLAQQAPRVVLREGSSHLLLPLQTPLESLGIAVFSRAEAEEWDLRVARSLASQGALGLQNARMHERERRVLHQYRLLSELGTDLLGTKDPEEVRERLLARTSEILGADACFIAWLDGPPDALMVHLRVGRTTETSSVGLSGAGRLAAIRLGAEPPYDPTVFEVWAREMFAAVAGRIEAASYLAEPLSVPTRVLGGLFAAWKATVERFPDEHQGILKVLAGSAGASLASSAAYQETDASLRRRLAELQVLTHLAQRTTGLTNEAPILDELLSAFRQLGRLRGAIHAVRGTSRWEVRQMSGLGDKEARAIGRALDRIGIPSTGMRLALSRDLGQVLVFPLPDGSRQAVVAGIGPEVSDPDDATLWALIRYGSVALENARLYDRQKEAIVRLEGDSVERAQRYRELQQVLSMHKTLAADVLEGRGLASVARSLSDLLGAAVAITGPQHNVLARWPADLDTADLGWPDPDSSEPSVATVMAARDGGQLVAAPAVVEGERVAWIVARLGRPVGEIDQAAIEYGALLAALDVLRERTALEVETRLRGGLLEELFGGTVVDDLMLKQGLAFGYDLLAPSRVLLLESPTEGLGRHDADLYGLTLGCAREWSQQHFVARRGNAIVVLVPEPGTVHGEESRCFEERLRAVLDRGAPSVSVNIGVGTLCRSLADYHQSYEAARRGLDLLRLLGREGQTFSFRRQAVEQVLLRSTEPSAILEFIARYVEPLERYDGRHSSQLRHSLETYYSCGLNLEATARRLHIHVSTLRYRLRKIAELLGVDPKRGDARLDVEVALKMAKVLASHPG